MFVEKKFFIDTIVCKCAAEEKKINLNSELHNKRLKKFQAGIKGEKVVQTKLQHAATDLRCCNQKLKS